MEYIVNYDKLLMPDFQLPLHSPLYGLRKCKNFKACKINLGQVSQMSDTVLLGGLNMTNINHYIVLLNELQIMSSNAVDNEIVLANDGEYK